MPNQTEIEGLIINALLRRSFELAVSLSVKQMLRAKDYRVAEDITRRLMPFFQKLTREQASAFAEAAVNNATVWDAAECAKHILPKFLERCGDKLSEITAKSLRFQITERSRYKE